MLLTIRSSLALNDGNAMPALGFGVYEAPPGRVTQEAVLHAFSLGYRHVDTASLYGNETDVGEAVRRSEIPRRDLWITTKLWNSDHGYDAALRAFDRSMQQLGLEQVDLYLIHWPVQGLRRESWKALCKLKAEGRCRSVGVSNYTVRHLKEMLDAGGLPPAVNQVEMSPFLAQQDLVDFCRKHDIVLAAYSPLTRGEKLGHPVVQKLAAKHQRSPAQILLRWGLQRGVSVLPKSTSAGRIRENADLFGFALDDGDMQTMKGLDEGFRTCWDPSRVI